MSIDQRKTGQDIADFLTEFVRKHVRDDAPDSPFNRSYSRDEFRRVWGWVPTTGEWCEHKAALGPLPIAIP